MAAIVGAGYAWRKFRNRNASRKTYDSNSFGAPDRHIGVAERTPAGTGAGAFGGSGYGTAGSSSSYSTGAGSGGGTGSLAGSGTSGMTGGGSVGSSGIRTDIGE